MNKFNWTIAASTAVILLSSCGNDYSNVASYTVEKQCSSAADFRLLFASF